MVNNLPKSKKVFFLYSCAKTSDRFTKAIKEKALEKDAVCLPSTSPANAAWSLNQLIEKWKVLKSI